MEMLLNKVEEIQDDQQNAPSGAPGGILVPANTGTPAQPPPNFNQSITAKMPPALERRLISMEERVRYFVRVKTLLKKFRGEINFYPLWVKSVPLIIISFAIGQSICLILVNLRSILKSTLRLP